ncbi:MAG: response regulator transcription factor [Bacteroidales bacterium]|nr:response regulator transcription factor [Bacteroidales bacterium]
MENAMRTLIIDDESPARQRLKELLTTYSDTFQLVGEAENGRKALELINKLDPDLIFLDIQMPGMTGFDLIRQLDKIPTIVFCTAYDQYSLDAFETNSIDYLVKPVKAERLEKTIEKLKRFSVKSNPNELMRILEKLNGQSEQQEMSSITIKKGNRLIFIKLEDVSYFQADERYVKVVTVQGDENISEKSLKELEERLPGSFMRIHRSIIINKNLIREIQSYFNSKYVFILNDNKKTKLFSSRSYHTQIKKWLDIK